VKLVAFARSPSWLALFACFHFTLTAALAQLSIDWHSVASGGGASVGGPFHLSASVGRLEANLATGGSFALNGDFWPGVQLPPEPRWVLRATNGPPPRYALSMAYDSARGVTVLYGGGVVVANVGYVGFGEVWEWNGAQWQQRTTYQASNAWHQVAGGYWQPLYGDMPAGRMQHAMAYDSRRGRVVMFGGRSAGPDNGDHEFNDTWEWDGLRWYFRGTNGPPAQFDHHMAYDPGRGVTVLWGGFGVSPAQIWEWDGNSWSFVSRTNSPATSYDQISAAMDYDTTLQQIFVGPITDGFRLNHYWSWDGQDWQDRGTGFGLFDFTPQGGAMVFDVYRRQSFSFGGQYNGTTDFYGGSMGALFDPTLQAWETMPDAGEVSWFVPEDFTNVRSFVARLTGGVDPIAQYLWSQFPTNTQTTLSDPNVTEDAAKQALLNALNVLLASNGLYDATRFGNVRLSTETTIFQAVQPVQTDLIRFNRLLLEDAYPAEIRRSPSHPNGRYYHAMAYDSVRRATVLFGGVYSFPITVGSETWELVAPDQLAIDEQPASQYSPAGGTAVFHVTARGPSDTPLNYQWFAENRPLSDNGHISGALGATLQIANVTPADAGSYHVLISTGSASLASLSAVLTLTPKLQAFNLQQNFRLVWGTPEAQLEQSDDLGGNWTVVQGATSPFNIAVFGSGKFFRVLPAP
jgi:hypothetical protein